MSIMKQPVFTIIFKVSHRLWVILTSDAITYREYVGIMLILTAVAVSIWGVVEGDMTVAVSLMFAFPFILAAGGIIYTSLINRRHAKRLAADRCVNCGYDLRGSPDRCPECGTALRQGVSRRAGLKK